MMIVSMIIVMNIILPPVSAEVLVEQNTMTNENVIHAAPIPIPTLVPTQQSPPQNDDKKYPIHITDIREYVSSWNEKMNWKLSQVLISETVEKLEKSQGPLSVLRKDEDGFFIPDYGDFKIVLARELGLNSEQTHQFIEKTTQERRVKDESIMQNAISAESLLRINTMPDRVNPATHSAPYAYGKVYYLYIFTDFEQSLSQYRWTQEKINRVLGDAYDGTHAITAASPSGACMSNDGGYHWVEVSGNNPGPDDPNSYGPNGWMERALTEAGYTNRGFDQYIIDDVARSIKSQTNSDAVIVMYFTADVSPGYALPLESGVYGERAVVAYWEEAPSSGGSVQASATTYQHEALHLFGAVDEYQGSNSAYLDYSYRAVSPMNRWYRNTNFHTINQQHDHNSVMCDHRNSGMISDSTRKFIGWGDHDGNGVIDLFDPFDQNN